MLKSRDKVFRVEDFTIDANSIFLGKTLRESGLLSKEGITVAAVKKGDRYIFNPSEEECLEIGNF